MNDANLGRGLAAALADAAPPRAPETLVPAVLARTAAIRPRPRWLAMLAYPPMRAGSTVVVGSATARRAALLIMLGAVLVTVVAGVLLLGATHQRPIRVPADRGFFRPVGPMQFVRETATATLLADGRVLVAGGYPPRTVDFGSSIVDGGARTAEIFDPRTELFTRTGDMERGRWLHAAVLLRDGRVLIVGGYSPGIPVNSPDGSNSVTNAPTILAELWDPATGSFSDAGSLAGPLEDVAAILKPDGSVLVTGRAWTGSDNGEYLGQVWDPGAKSFGAQRPLVPGEVGVSRGSLGPTRTLLPDGRILIAGGTGSTNEDEATRSCGPGASLFDPVTGVSEVTGSLSISRGHHAAVLLADGRALLVGNYWLCPQPWSAEIFVLR